MRFSTFSFTALAAFWFLAANGQAPVQGQVAVQPFYVSKVSPSAGNYSTRDFAMVWAAFCEQYRLGPKGTFVQYPFARETIKSAVGSGGYYEVRHLFREVKPGDTGGHLIGAQNSYSGRKSILNEADAREAVMQYGTKILNLRIGNQSTIARPGAYECVLLNQPNAQIDQDRDLRDEPARRSSYQSDYLYRGPTYIYFADPASPKQGEVQIRVSREMTEQNGQSGLCYYEVAKLQDTKQNQDNFVEALKAGSCFRVYVFKQSACYNCGGLGRIAAKAASGSRGGPRGLIGSSSIDDKCKLCAGSGRLPLGKVYALVWDRYIPSDEDFKSMSSER